MRAPVVQPPQGFLGLRLFDRMLLPAHISVRKIERGYESALYARFVRIIFGTLHRL